MHICLKLQRATQRSPLRGTVGFPRTPAVQGRRVLRVPSSPPFVPDALPSRPLAFHPSLTGTADHRGPGLHAGAERQQGPLRCDRHRRSTGGPWGLGGGSGMDSFPLPPLSTATHTAHDNPAFPTIGVVEGWQASKWGTDVYVAMSAFLFGGHSPLRALRKFWPPMFVVRGTNPFLFFFTPGSPHRHRGLHGLGSRTPRHNRLEPGGGAHGRSVGLAGWRSPGSRCPLMCTSWPALPPQDPACGEIGSTEASPSALRLFLAEKKISFTPSEFRSLELRRFA